jgi:hypothetical protein
MIKKCDICGGFIDPNARFCGGCGVDLRDPKGSELPDTEKKNTVPTMKKTKAKLKKNPEEGDVIHWHAVRALCNSY